ncbi:DUF5916 domain-containing protein [Rubrivirga sp. IMCC43871]|uniref:DUF5916 domain-containing protein n=1 Tax=Rubrivirga sp. IMCC43871 TaxID=3391575 RepID=UPI00398FB2BF
MRLSTLLFAAALLAAPALAQPTSPDGSSDSASASGPRGLVASPLSADVDLDGRLDEAAWADAPVASGFVQFRPSPGDAASERTEARVLYDGTAVYIGMRMHESRPDGIGAPLGRRDANLTGDWAMVALDSYHDGRTAFVFALNPAGVQRDFLLYDDVNEDDSWDAVWAGAASQDETGWTAEFRIPLSQLRYAAGQGTQEWGLQFGRTHHRTGEEAFWSPMSPDENGMVSQFGTLSGLRDLRPPRQLEIMPYVASSLTRAPGDDLDPFFADNDLDPRVGLDLKYGLTSDLTLTATVNPDFGQVEGDPSRVNLGGFELFNQERRPFFVEGTDVFSMQPRRFFGMNRPSLLYTRRIGRNPQRSNFVPDEAHDAVGENGTVYTDSPQQSTILGAAKLSGRIGGFSVGVLDAVTGPEYGRFMGIDGDGAVVADDRALVEPTTNFAAARAKATLGKTIIGLLGTSVIRSTADPAIESALPGQGTVLGFDVEHALNDDWIINGQLAGSHVTGSASSIDRVQRSFPRLFQRPDADHLDYDPTRTSISGLTGEMNVLKSGGEHWVGSLHAEFTSPGFDANQLGFQSRADEVGIGSVIVYQQNQEQGPFQRWSANLFGGTRLNFDGDRSALFTGGNVNGRLKNFWGFGANGEVYAASTNDRLTRGGPIAASPGGYGLNVNGWTDDRKPVSAFAWTGLNRDDLGGRFNGVEVGAEIRPSSSVTVRIGPELFLSGNPRQYITSDDAPGLDATFGRRYVFGEIDQTTVSLDTRVDWTFTPQLSLQVYARPFVSRGRYSNFSQMTEARQLDFPRFGADIGTIEPLFADGADPATDQPERYRVTGPDGGTTEFGNPNFTVRSLQGNAVLRWEYRPGSALFLVWQQQRSGFSNDGGFEFDRDVSGLFTDPVTNVFVLKLSYWLG